MSRGNGGNSVNNESEGRAVYQITTIPERHYFHCACMRVLSCRPRVTVA